jgi:hypothetical protein
MIKKIAIPSGHEKPFHRQYEVHPILPRFISNFKEKSKKDRTSSDFFNPNDFKVFEPSIFNDPVSLNFLMDAFCRR